MDSWSRLAACQNSLQRWGFWTCTWSYDGVLDMWHYSCSCFSIGLIRRFGECVFLTHRKLVQAGLKNTVSIGCHDMLITLFNHSCDT